MRNINIMIFRNEKANYNSYLMRGLLIWFNLTSYLEYHDIDSKNDEEIVLILLE